MREDVKFVLKGGRTGGILGGVGGAAVGGLLGSKKMHKVDGKKEPRSTKSRVIGGLGGAAFGGAYGGIQGRNIGMLTNAVRWQQGHRPKPSLKDMPSWLKGAKNKAEARKRYHSQARKAHPDAGGSDKAMGDLSTDFKKWEGHFKTAMLDAFCDEMQKIAMIKKASLGALLGGAAGAALSPGGLKSKIVGGAVGAGLGAAAHGAKKAFWDEPRAREHAELYGYTPSAAQQMAQSPYQSDRFM